MRQVLSVPEQLGPLLQARRKGLGLSQTALAARMGLSQSRVSAMELEPASISLAQLLSLCNALGLELTVQPRASDAGRDAGTDW